MTNQLRRLVALICVLGIGLIYAPNANAAPAITIDIEASADTVAAGRSVIINATVDGARPDDTVAIGIKSASGWTELAREAAGDQAEHTFEVTPPVLGRNVYRVGVLRGSRLLAASPPAVVTGTILVDPDPVEAGQAATLSGKLPTPIERPVALQVEIDDAWKTVDADFSAEDGTAEFTWSPTESTRVRFVAPARSIEDKVYPRFVSPAADVTVTEPEPQPEPEPTVTRVTEGLSFSPQLSGDGRHLVYASDPAVTAPAVYSSSFFREDDPVRTRLVPDVGDPASSSVLGLSANGRYVLINGQPKPAGSVKGVWALYVWDTTTDEVDKLISFPDGTYGPLNARISADGSTVAFASKDDGLLPGDDNKTSDGYVIKRDGTDLRRITNGSDGRALPSGGWISGLSADGSVALFSTADPLDGDQHPGVDAYRWTAADQGVELVTEPDSDELTYFSNVVLSEDGRFVAYSLDTGMLYGRGYVWDAEHETREQVPVIEGGSVQRRVSRIADLSDDGRYGLFADVTTSGTRLFRWDRSDGSLDPVSGTEFGPGRQTTAVAGGISDDGTVIAFDSVPDDGTFRDKAVFVWSVRE